MTIQQRIRITSRIMRWIVLSLMVLIPVLNVLFWVTYDGQYAFLSQQISNLPIHGELSPLFRAFGFIVCFIPTGIIMAGLFHLSQLFKLYEGYHIFTDANVRCYRRLGQILILWVFSTFLYDPLMSIVLTYNNPPGQRMIQIGFESVDLTALLIGVVVLIVSWVMQAAKQLKDEQDLTI
ncbi:MAG: DUF2975 domain-containing protein [Desulfobacteraceae bacterium]|nr:DUF2975 domain-containing protein [Desulfobacteraceae bacterium]